MGKRFYDLVGTNFVGCDCNFFHTASCSTLGLPASPNESGICGFWPQPNRFFVISNHAVDCEKFSGLTNRKKFYDISSLHHRVCRLFLARLTYYAYGIVCILTNFEPET